MEKKGVASLHYDAAAELLTGKVGEGPAFRIPAVSGGGRGSTKAGVAESTLVSRLATTPLVKRAGGEFAQRGGTLPPGVYRCIYIRNHPKFHECILLQRDASTLHVIHSPHSSMPIPHHRGNDFFIHGRGQSGSDGCIVPLNPALRLKLTHAIRDFHGMVVLNVSGVSYMLPAEHHSGSQA